LHALAETFGNPEAAGKRPPDGGAVMCSAKKSEIDNSGLNEHGASCPG
jgi:hypothetical protein